MTDSIVITDPADWRAGDHLTIEGTLASDTDGDLYLRASGYDEVGIYARLNGIITGRLRALDVKVTRTVPTLPTAPGTVFRADGLHYPVGAHVFEVGLSGNCYAAGYNTSVPERNIDASTVEILWEPGS